MTWRAGEVSGYRHIELVAGPTAPGQARREVRRLLGDGETASTAALLLTEMVTNAVLHGTSGDNSTVLVDLEMQRGRLRMEVADQGDGFDAGAGSFDGFGLRLIAGLADTWGVEPGPPHRVWCEITV